MAERFLLFFLLLVCFCVHPVVGTWEQIEKMFFGGRWWRDGDSMKHNWGIGTFVVRFVGSGSISIDMTSPTGGAYYTCQVDDGEKMKVLHNSASLMTFSGLSLAGEHILRCNRNNEASYGYTIISGVSMEAGGELLQAINPNAANNMLRFEAIGDSITAGFKVLTPSNSGNDPATIANQDVFKTYIALMAEAWGTTDYQVIAKSGISINDYGTTGVVMGLEWPCREFWQEWRGSCPQEWDFSAWQADVVTINLGTNDFAFGDPTQQEFRIGYLNLIQDVREKYPNALIACIEPIQHMCGGENFPELTGIVNGLEEAVNDMADEKVIYYETGSSTDPWLDCSMNTEDFMDFTHPTVKGNEKFASRLLEKMTVDVRKFFPQKCGGSGSTCNNDISTTSPPNSPPIDPPSNSPTSLPTEVVTAGADSRLIAYLGNWQSCPTEQQLQSYTHIVIAFAVSYTWNQAKNQCSETCEIATPPVCNNQANQQLISNLQAAGKKVILSFGGAGMGGSWDGDNNDCWNYCFGKEEKVVERLVEIVSEMGLDGVDIDYEYFYDNNQPNAAGRGFTQGTAARKFLKDITLGLRSSLPAGSEITHAPMDGDVVAGTGYYNVLKEVASHLDYLMPQYYNGKIRPAKDGLTGTGVGSQAALPHYNQLVNDMFSGDATKVVFGFCISDCTSTNSDTTGAEAATVMGELNNYYSCNGGAFFWVVLHDVGGAWSSTISTAIEPNVGCSTGQVTGSPSIAGTVAPSPEPNSPSPTPSPSRANNGNTPDVVCLAVLQETLPSGTWATTDTNCAKCADGYLYWPCDTSPALCKCGVANGGSTPTTTPADSDATQSDSGLVFLLLAGSGILFTLLAVAGIVYFKSMKKMQMRKELAQQQPRYQYNYAQHHI